MVVPGRLSRCCEWRWWSIAAILWATTGCGSRNIYQIEMRLTDEGFVRTVDVASHPRPAPEADAQAAPLVSEEERKVFSEIYGPGQLNSESERFEGTFVTSTPDDVGGSGSLTRWTSELGDTFVYHERFRGRLPSLHDRKLREAAIDQVVSWTSDWLDEELAGVAGAGEIKQFVTNDWRTDLQDLACLLEVTAGNVSEHSSADQGRPLLLVAHFLIERGYLTFTDLAELPLNDLSETEQQRWGLERLRRKLISSTGLSADAEPLQRLEDHEALGRRFLDFLGRTPEYQLWREEQLAANAVASTEPAAFLGHSLEAVSGPLFASLLNWGGIDELTLVLHTAVKPLETNGQWQAESGSVRWQWRLARRSLPPQEADWIYSTLPQVAFAQWVQVNQARQEALFGQVLIRETVLRDYCLWRQRLSEPQAARWQTLLDKLPALGTEERIAALTELKQQWSEEFAVTPSIIDILLNRLASP